MHMSFLKPNPTGRRREARRFFVLLFLLPLITTLAPQARAASMNPGPAGGFRIVAVRQRSKTAPPNLAPAGAETPSPVPAYLASIPPLEGPVLTVALTITDQRQDTFDILATPQTGLAGSLLPTSTTNLVFGLLDSGSGTHLVSYPNAIASGLQGDYLSGNTFPAGGVDGSVDMDVSEPVGFFVLGLQDLNAQGQPNPSSMVGLGNFAALVNTLDNYQAGSDVPTLIGAPHLLYFPAYIRNSQPVSAPTNITTLSSPSITFYSNPTDPQIPSLAHKIFLQLRPTGAEGVAYLILLDENPFAPSTITAGLGAGSLFFTASSMTLHQGANTSSGQMVVDTGSQATLLSEIAAAELDLDLQNPDFEVDVQGISTTVTAPGFYIDSASIPAGGGAVNWTNIPVVILDVGSPEGGTLYGIFGSNLIATRDAVFNGAASTPYLGVTDPIVAPRMRITQFRLSGPNTVELDWHAEPAPPVIYVQQCTNLGVNPPNWTTIATNAPGIIDGSLTITGIVSRAYFRLQAPD